MSRHILALAHAQRTPLDLDAFVTHADALNQHHRETFTTLFPKAPRRWLSPSVCTPRPIALTQEGDVDGGLSWLGGATIAFSLTRSIWAPRYGTRGAPCDDPASLVLLEVAATGDQDVDSAHCCRDLHQADNGHRSRQRAGLHAQVPGQDAFWHVRSRVGDDVLHKTIAIVVALLRPCGLLQGEGLSTAGQLAPSSARDPGCPYACEGCPQFPIAEADQPELRHQLPSGAKRFPLTCPCPQGGAKVRAATAKKGNPREPKITLRALEDGAGAAASSSDRPQVARVLGGPQDQGPPVRLTWCHVRQTSQGALVGSCPKVPSDLEAKGGYHVDNTDPSKKDLVFGYLHINTTARNRALGLDLPLGNSPYAADAHEGTACSAHRAALALPVLPGQGHLGDAADDVTATYHWIHAQGGIPVFAYHPRHAHLDPESLGNRGYDQHGTPSAPCGRLCRSKGYAYQAQSQPSGCGLQCPPEEQQHGPQRFGVLG